MPILGEDMTEGKLVEWRKQVGEAVKRGDIIADVETDKGLIEIEVFFDGVLEAIVVQPGEIVPVGAVLAVIRRSDEAAAAARPPMPRAEPPRAVPAPAVAPPVIAPIETERRRVSPSARKLAAELRVDLATVRGTGPGGAVQREDIERAARGAKATPAEEEAERRRRMRRAIGAAMARSKREIPHYYLATTIDLQRAISWLSAENEKRPVTERLLVGILLIKAVALAVRQVPELNTVWRQGEPVQQEAVHVGVAISLRQGGLMAPALHDTDRRSLDDLMRGFRDLVKRARGGGIRGSELSDPTITVTSIGEQGVETVFGIIYPPQSAMVGFGKIVERPWSVDGHVVSRPLVQATLSGDHRVSDGHRGGLFLAAVDGRLQEPEKL